MSERSPSAAGLAAKAKDLESLRDALVDAASISMGLWISYLFVLFYLAIAAGSVTHRDLFLTNPVKLPFLNVDLPLIGFFVLGPGLLIIVHFYVLLHFALLAEKVGVFHVELQSQVADPDVRVRLRRQLPSNIFVQFLAGPAEVRTGPMGFMLRLIAHISLVAGPVAVLVLFQFQFLPYHDEAITWWHRVLIVVDLALLWMLWPSVVRGEMTKLAWRDLRRGTVASTALASLGIVLLVFCIGTFPGEKLDANLPTVRFIPINWSTFSWSSVEWTSLHKMLVAGEVDRVTQKPTSLWSNRLVLPGIDVIDPAKLDTEEKIAAARETVSFRGRHLEGAILSGARLTKADFTAAHLQGADLYRADLRMAKLVCETGIPIGVRVPQHCTNLEGAELRYVQLNGADLTGALLQGAKLLRANLEAASLIGADLRGALLSEANLRGAAVSGQLQGALLDGAQLEGAWLAGAQLQATSLNATQLQATSLKGAQLQGASLFNTQLQGSLLEDADLQDALLEQVYVWRADARSAKVSGARVVKPELGRKIRGLDCRYDPCVRGLELNCRYDPCDWSPEIFATLKQIIEKADRASQFRTDSTRTKVLDPAVQWQGEDEMATLWSGLERSSPSPDVHERGRAVRLRDTGCGKDGTPHVIRGIMAQIEVESENPLAASLIESFLDEANCIGARGLSEADRVDLRRRLRVAKPKRQP